MPLTWCEVLVADEGCESAGAFAVDNEGDAPRL